MDLVIYFALLSAYGAKEAWTLYCYNCLSLEKYDANCTILRGKGEYNVNKYYTKCSTLKNACSLYIGQFKEDQDKPLMVVWRKCDFVWDDEPECRNTTGPRDAWGGGENKGLTCHCQTDFCNWREGEDVDLPPGQKTKTSVKPQKTTTRSPPTGGATATAPTAICVVVYTLERLLYTLRR